MASTIVDVARKAGVSTATVSRVLHNSRLVKEDTRARVLRAMEELNYSPNIIAQGLVTRRTRAIGLVITSIADPFFADVVRGVEETALDHGYSLFLVCSSNDPQREIAAVSALRSRRVDAILVASSRVGSLYYDLLESIRVPLVLINNQHTGAYGLSVATDDRLGGYLATSHLLGHGHRRIAYIQGPPGHWASALRQAGYSAALTEADLPVLGDLIVPGDGRADGGVEAVSLLLDRGIRPTAIFCYNDMTAIGAMRALRTRGIGIPEDISVVGYDDVLLASYVEPPLTTIAQQRYELGRRAMELALQRLAGGEGTAHAILLEPYLVERSSCRSAPPRE